MNITEANEFPFLLRMVVWVVSVPCNGNGFPPQSLFMIHSLCPPSLPTVELGHPSYAPWQGLPESAVFPVMSLNLVSPLSYLLFCAQEL